jgi:hypothetical protein
MIADGPLSPYSALFTKLLFWDSWKVTFEKKSTAIIRKRSAQVVCGRTHLSDDTTPQKRGIPLAFFSVFGIEVWDFEGADGLWLDLVRVLFRVLHDVSSE